MTNRGKQNQNDEWLTPQPLIEALGPFDLDPCCPPAMPWRTAKVMLTDRSATQKEIRAVEKFTDAKALLATVSDGLLTDWSKVAKGRGRVWLNFPYSAPIPWVELMADHGKGMILGSAKSTDTRWCQRLLSTADLVYWLDDRISFCYPNGLQSGGKWSPYLLAAYGRADCRALEKFSQLPEWPGCLMQRAL